MLRQWYEEYISRGWGDISFEEYKKDVHRRCCLLSGQIIPFDELEEYLKNTDVNKLLQ